MNKERETRKDQRKKDNNQKGKNRKGFLLRGAPYQQYRYISQYKWGLRNKRLLRKFPFKIT